MYMPSSGNNAALTDVWGSALAVHVGAAPPARAARIVAWFGANWESVVQDGQIRHLPLGQHWPNPAFWEYDTYQNGGYWGTASSWVLPVIGRNNTLVARQLVRDAIADARLNGINEWHNNAYCSNCVGVPRTDTVAGKCSDHGLGCQSYPLHGNWFGGALTYGPNIGSIYVAAKLLLALPPRPPPPSPPSPPPPPPPPGPLPACNLTGSWTFYSASAHASETNGFFETANGRLRLSPGANDGWKTATGVLYTDFDLDLFYYADKRAHARCNLAHNCSFIACPTYTYTKLRAV
jgi:hypothetical protein